MAFQYVTVVILVVAAAVCDQGEVLDPESLFSLHVLNKLYLPVIVNNWTRCR